jgi:hypothetical protein
MKSILLFFICFLSSSLLFANSLSIDEMSTSKVVNNGLGLGSILAVVASWSRNKSILWGILHGLLSWVYVIYFALTRSKGNE